MLSGSRQIRSETITKDISIIKINPNDCSIHPTTLDNKINNAENKVMELTNYYINNGELKNWKEGKILSDKEVKARNFDNFKEAMKISNLTFDSESLINIYLENTTSPSELDNYINTSINQVVNFNTINRVINMWIWNNIKILKTHNNFLEKIYYDILTKYNKELVNDNLKKNIKQYIDYWTQNKTENDFDFNLYRDLIEHLKKI